METFVTRKGILRPAGAEDKRESGANPGQFPPPAADVAEQPQPQTVDGVASPAQASVSDLTGEQPCLLYTSKSAG